jgi:eukaryotic-like serine/threonine-protein kinase
MSDGPDSARSRRVGADEPTQIDARPPASRDGKESGASRGEGSEPSADSTGTGAGSGFTGITSQGRSAQSGVTTASPLILRAEEHTRSVALARLVIAMAVAATVAIWLPQRESPGRWAATASVALGGVVSVWMVFELRDPQRYDWRKVLFHGLCCVAAILATTYYVGVFSPTIIAMYVGVYFFGLSDSVISGWVIFLSGTLGYFALCVLSMIGVIPTDRSVLPLGRIELPALFAVTFVTQALFATTFWMARHSRKATLAAFERLERAARQIRKRDALLNEARADIDGERAAKMGRFTDQQVGKYVVGEVIGRGAMGEVYRAWETGNESPVAIKFLNAAMAGEASGVERFFREVEIASRIKSRHIVQMLDHGLAEGGSPFLVMELLSGKDLAADLRDKKRLGMGATLGLIGEVAQALSAADEAGIVHRDLKPQNLFSAEHGATRTWKVLDFGVSKILASGKDLTMGAAVGTPSYMSPEQARGEEVDHRADVFALGVIAYRVITGRPAFTGPDSASTLYNVVHVQPVRPSELVRVGPDIERALALALAKEKERRFASAIMFATALTEAARQRLDERLRKDADALLAEQPWGQDLLQVLKDDAKRWQTSKAARTSRLSRSNER